MERPRFPVNFIAIESRLGTFKIVFKTQIEKLEGSKNWTKWKRQIDLLLLHRDVLDLITVDLVKPNDAGIAATTEQRKSFETKVKAFKKNDALAQFILVDSMDNANVEFTSTCDSAKSSRAVDKGSDFKGDKNGCYLFEYGSVHLAGKRTPRGLYALKLKVLMPEKSAAVTWKVVPPE
ncbi:hypothetical protein AVEN_184843-1 [Araneus ventricosus]|uniref:Uncharacterized protein n=1 Tax=Araneus ventricosus TaxID=182803 RepID=A0A4Y2LEB1_ARAVE|nr:hypothetical protein AVEN_184843-1 [Araneus ventricosus]